jgi:hypothetical protein
VKTYFEGIDFAHSEYIAVCEGWMDEFLDRMAAL